MNNTFDINRFGLLIRKQWLEYGKLYLIVLGILTGILCTIYGFMYWQIANYHGNPYTNRSLELNFRNPLFVFFSILFISLAATHYFAPLAQKPKAILEFTLPASSLEKFLVGILYSCIFAILSYLLIFCLVDFAFVSKLRTLFPTAVRHRYLANPERILNEQIPLYFFEKVTRVPIIMLSPLPGSMLLSSIFLLGSLVFKRFQYIKTAITTLVFGGVWLTFTINTKEFVFRNKVTSVDFGMGVAQYILGWGLFAILVILAIISYVIAYIRFKEKEV